ncbi:MAG TPA: hypothetical protein DCY27_07695 [Desulfobacterales bacterium]|nr:hypothetical protein [Desulfobacterales bacterium]
MAIQQTESKWRRLWRLMKKWHYVWLPPAIIFFDRLLIMWPYIPLGEATCYMKAQAIETFDASIWWTIHLGETLILLLAWLYIILISICLVFCWLRKVDKLYREQKYINRLNANALVYAIKYLAQDQILKYLHYIYKQSKHEPVLLKCWTAGWFEVRALGRKEYRERRKHLQRYTPAIGELVEPEAEVIAEVIDFWRLHRYCKQHVEEQEAARQRGEGPVEATSGAGEMVQASASDHPPKREPAEERAAGSAKPVVTEPAAPVTLEQEVADAAAILAGSGQPEPPVAEQEQAGPGAAREAAAGGRTAEQPPVPRISVERALYLAQNKIESKNSVRQIMDKPPLTAAEEEEIKESFLSQVDPEELAAWRAGQESEEAAVASEPSPACQAEEPEPEKPAAPPGMGPCLVSAGEESGLVCAGPVAQDDGMPDDDNPDDTEDDMDEQVSADQWSAVLAQAGGDPLVAAIMLMMQDRDEWRGSPNELLATLGLYAPDEVKASKAWPKNAAWLVRRDLKDRQSSWAPVGLSCEPSKDHQGRWVVIKWA